MNEFKLPIKKAWQTGSQPVEVVAPIIADAAPTTAPIVAGAMWVKVKPGYAVWISVGTESVSDWILIAD